MSCGCDVNVNSLSLSSLSSLSLLSLSLSLSPTHTLADSWKRSYQTRTQAKERKQKKTKRCLLCPVSEEVRQAARQTERTQQVLRALFLISRHKTLASLASFSQGCLRTGMASREKTRFALSVSHSSLFSLSLSLSRFS